ncbi:glycosyltransferase [Pedobacter flavus]|uniref:Glycosyltransferase n=1 Tax=Pedobacter flavus TaxID=3113906 RepID=A0ABU7H075_9SPHI|nr:glycosyltransferase [Pedobacter sp. VNH31]MEE1884720.1 glycosyltransferase [Pedobacter sp. VNH31]
MKISVVIPNFNDLRISRAINSVQSQTYKNIELIVADGGSKNEELLAYYSQLPNVKVNIEKDNGIFDALNKGIALATGDVIYLMGSDDYLSDNLAFEQVVNKFNANSSLDGVCIGCEFFNEEGKIIRTWYPDSVSSKKIKWGIFPPHFSLFLKRHLYEKVGPFNYKLYNNIAGDTVWLLDLAVKVPDFKIDVLNAHHLKMEYGGASTGSKKAVIRQFKVVADYAKRNSKHLPAWFLLSPIRTFSKVFQLKF